MAMLVEIMLAAEAALERRLCGLAICQPKIIAVSTIRPEIDQGAIAYFKKFDAQINDIQSADELGAITLAVGCCSSYRDFWRFYAAIDGLNTCQVAPNFGAELIAARTARKTIRWVEESGLLKEGMYDG